MKSIYRPDIDGLRAVAVIPVILFHAGFSAVKGGFVGVDIFFVISGYLITSAIAKEMDAGIFSFSRFYERRLRRIFPALLAMMLFAVASFQLLALPDQAEDASKSALSAILSLSNVYFWRQSGYFAPAVEFFPLLHTWSLSVEEQFYVIFPAILLLLVKFNLRSSLVYLAIFGLLFCVGVWMSFYKPSAAYYLLPSRAWELFLGAMIALNVFPKVRSKFYQEILPLLGLVLIFLAFLYADKNSVFPGYVALLPCVGAALIIIGDGSSWVSRIILSSKPMVSIGALSYSLYLWHWPVFVILKIKFLSISMPVDVAIFGILITFILAWLSWRYVEGPFRNYNYMNSFRALVSIALGVVSVVAISCVSIYLNGFDGRLSDRGKMFLSGAYDTQHFNYCVEKYSPDACLLGDNDGALDFIVVGDSHTPVLHNMFNQIAYDLGMSGILYWHRACPLLDGVMKRQMQHADSCLNFRKKVFERISEVKGLKAVFLIGSWASWYDESLVGVLRFPTNSFEGGNNIMGRRSDMSLALQRTLDQINSDDVVKVIIGAPPHIGFDVPRMLALSDLHGSQNIYGPAASDVSDFNYSIDSELDFISKNNMNTFYLPVWDIFCRGSMCDLYSNDTSLYSDEGHLSYKGVSDFLAPLLTERIKGIFD